MTYDADGNRTTMALSGTTTLSYTTTSNQLQSLTGTTTANYAYDAMGNTTSDGTNVWTYDARGRMSTLTAGTTTAAYDINGFGQRIEKTGSSVPSGGTNEYVYDEQGNLLGEYGSTGTIIEETGYLPNTPVSVLSNGFGIAGLGAASPTAVYTGASGATVASLTPDWLNAPHIITNSSKTYLWRWDHYDFGNNAPNQNPAGAGNYPYNLRFPGQYYDAESSLFYNGLRDYNPTVGRYAESDPAGLLAGINTYAYVEADPLTEVDPFGMCKVQLGYNLILNGHNGHAYYHTFIVTTDSTSQKVFHAYPSHTGHSWPHLPNPLSWGYLKTAFDSGDPDNEATGHNLDTLYDDGKPCTCENAVLQQDVYDINNARIPYKLLGPNSNSAAHFALQTLGLSFTPTFNAPGWDAPLSVSPTQ
jgi:RHS repeat-associated protein